MKRRRGCGLVCCVINRAVDALPVVLHLPGYKFCGPGTKLGERLALGERGINELDEACRDHDIANDLYKDNERRRVAYRKLANKAWERVKAWNSGVSERAYAAAVAAAMKAKSALGGGSSGGRKKKKEKKTGCKRPKTMVGGGRRGGARREGRRERPDCTCVRIEKTSSYTGPSVVRTELHVYAIKLKIPYFRGVHMRNALPTTRPRINESATVNLDDESGPGTHLVCYKTRGNRVYYFDVYGHLRSPVELMRYFTTANVRYNYERKQPKYTVICGHLCLEFLASND